MNPNQLTPQNLKSKVSSHLKNGTSKKALLASLAAAILVIIIGALSYGAYQQSVADDKAKENIAAAKKYVAAREEANKKVASANYAAVAAKQDLSLADNKNACSQLSGAASTVSEIKDFKDNGYAKDDASVKNALELKNTYPMSKAVADIKNLVDVCSYQNDSLQFIESMNSAGESMSPDSTEFYAKSAELMKARAESIKKSCPFTYLTPSAKQVCDHNQQRMEKYARANQMLVDAEKNGSGKMSVAEQAMALYDEADKDLSAEVYREILGEEATEVDFGSKYVTKISSRLVSL